VHDQTFHAVILGVLQGLTEFLPISSSAHLILLPWMMGWEELGITFDVVLHGGTLLAILIYFRRDWLEVGAEALGILRSPGRLLRGDSLLEAIAVGTLPAIFVALIFKDLIERYARIPIVTVFTLSLFGLLLWWADRKGRTDRPLSGIHLRDGLLIGLAQSLALIPGVSRSGITITGALLLGFSRSDSARFSFLLAGPIMVLGAAAGILDLVKEGEQAPVGIGALIAGVLASFVVGYFCIKYFLRFLASRDFLPFVGYRLVLAGVILALFLAGWGKLP